MRNAFCASVVIGILNLCIGGCSFAPKPEVAAAADYGNAITVEDMKSEADKALVRVLKDPDSRRVEWGQAGKAWMWTGIINGGTKYGYGLEALVNAKNSFGGYVGSKPYFFFFQNQTMVYAGELLQNGMHGFTP